MRVLTGLALFACIAFAQPKAMLEFEVASVKPAPSTGGGAPGCSGGPGSPDPAQITCQINLARLVLMAYDVKFVQMVAADWLVSARFAIQAKVPEGATKEQVSEMWRNLLAQRFHLQAHHESREKAHFELVVAKNGPKLKPAAGSGPPPIGSVGRRADGIHLDMPRLTIAGLASMLEGQTQQPIADATGIKGEYDIQLQWLPDLAVSSGPDSAPPLTQALQDQLGLKLEAKKGPLDMFVIDHIDRTPTEN